MALAPLITLLTDFGCSDVYAGVMKGAIAQINRQIQVIDLTHEIPPQDVLVARFQLLNAYPYFPFGTVHVAVVDPGVGSLRRAIAVQLEAGFLVGPDNGLFSGVLSQYPALAAVELTNTRYWRSGQPSATFHGRDIFAPVAAHLASGVLLSDLGPAIALETLVQQPIPPYESTETGWLGCIQASDRFGNLITNIPGKLVQSQPQHWAVQCQDQTIPSGYSYSDRPTGGLMALVGSHGWVEIAVNGGSAQARLGLTYGDRVQVVWDAAVTR